MTVESVAVVIPTYRAAGLIGDVLAGVPDSISSIYVVDDACPERSGVEAVAACDDPRVELVELAENQGVGGATLTGFAKAFDEGHDYVVKIDADGQIAPELAPEVVDALRGRGAGYCKGSRFTTPKNLAGMPRSRVILNAILSITNKLASGYYSLSDPTNGLIGLTRAAWDGLEPDRINRRFFFESDLMHHLNLARIVGVQIPMAATYGDEQSNLSFWRSVTSFMGGTTKNFMRRVFLRHFVLSFSLAAIYLVVGIAFSLFAAVFGIWAWATSARTGEVSNAGTVAIVVLTAIIGINFISTFFVFDVNDEPGRTPS